MMPSKEQFEAYDREHPEVWELFKKLAFELIDSGQKRFAARGIFHRIRWQFAVTPDQFTHFKLCNNYSPWYARKFLREFPKHKNFFRLRPMACDFHCKKKPLKI